MSEQSTSFTADPAFVGIHTHIERLKATEELLSSLLSQGRPVSEAFTSSQDAEPPTAAAHGARRWWRRHAG